MNKKAAIPERRLAGLTGMTGGSVGCRMFELLKETRAFLEE